MSYYRGDFVRGYYGRGDPGFFSFLGSLGKGLAQSAISAVPVVGKPISEAMMRIGGGTGVMATAGRAVSSAIVKHPVLSAAGGAAAVAGIAGGAGALMAGGPGVPMKGFHVCKGLPRHPCKRGTMVRNRHMRVTNPRALRRSLRRISGFSRLARRVLHFTHPRSRGRLAFRFPKRRRK